MATANNSLGLTAKQAGLARCTYCGALHRMSANEACRKCAAPVHDRKPKSLQRTWAYWIVGLMAYFPANLYPIMQTKWLGGESNDTILTGVVLLAQSGSLFVALVVLVASVVIPVTKFIVIAGLALSLQLRWTMSEHSRLHLHTIIEFIGRWSMIDVFVVAVLAALIQLGAILSIEPGPGINAFALSVVFTMLSANSLDPRLIWDAANDGES